MNADQTAPASKKMVWTGCVLSGVAVLFMLFDGVMKLIKPDVVVKATVELGYPESVITGLGVALLASTVFYIIPRTTVLGAILLTGYLGGAVASNVRAGTPLFNIVFPFIFGTMVWGGLFLRDARIRAVISGPAPLQPSPTS